MLKARRVANKLQRIHNKSRHFNSVLGQQISELYHKRKEILQNAIKRREIQNKMRLFADNGTSNKNKSKNYWNLLRGPREQKTVSQIIDPVGKSHMFEEKEDINRCLSSHFGSIGTDSTISLGFKQHILDFVQDKSNVCNGENFRTLTFDKESISNTLGALKSGKAPGIDGIPNEFLKYGGDTMVQTLSILFTFISDFEQVPEEWQRGIIKPIHKSGSLYDLDNYRGITLTSNVYKLFSKTLESIVVNYLESNNILGEYQGAFRKDRRLEDHIFTLHGICSLSKSSRKPLYVAFLDLSKAFDRVWRDGLFANLWNHGIQGKCWRLIRNIYKNVQNKVLFGEFESEWFDQDFGVKQGCTLSPTLFSILMNDLVEMLKNSNIGVEISSKIINCLLFADDVVLFANSPGELQELLRISYKFANKWNLRFNSKKSKVMVMGKKPRETLKWRLGNETIDETTEYKYMYLGCFINRSLKSNFHVNNYLKDKAENNINYLIRILGEHGDFNRINFGTSLWNSILRPSLTHASAVWMPLSQSSRDALTSWKYKAAKAVLRTKLNIPRSALFLELGWEPITTFIDRQRIMYFKRLSDLPDSRLCKQVYNEMVRLDEHFWNYTQHIESTMREIDYS